MSPRIVIGVFHINLRTPAPVWNEQGLQADEQGILKVAVTTMVPYRNRATDYGVF